MNIDIKSVAHYRYEGSTRQDYYKDTDPTRGSPCRVNVTKTSLNLSKTIPLGQTVPVKPAQRYDYQEEMVYITRSGYVTLMDNKYYWRAEFPRDLFSPYDSTKLLVRLQVTISSSSSFQENPPRATSYEFNVGSMLSSAVVLLSKMYRQSNYQRVFVFFVAGYLKLALDKYELRVDIQTWQNVIPEQYYQYETYIVDTSVSMTTYSEQEGITPQDLNEQIPWPLDASEDEDEFGLISLFEPPCVCSSCVCCSRDR